MSKGRFWQIVARKTGSLPQLGLAISKKVHKLAVERNRFKRIARETFRLNQHQLNHWEFVVMAKSAKPADNTVITNDLLNLFKKIVK